MLFYIFDSFTNVKQYLAIASILAFAICFVLLKLKLPFLPKDKGRAFAINGEVSKGKIRGVGLIMISTFVLCSIFLLPITKELIFYDILIFLEMLSGYLDDASDNPWSDYKKGFIDLIICVLISVVFVYNNSTTIMIFNYEIYVHPILFVVLSTILLWVGINVTNCSDGVDGLCGSLSIISLLSISSIFFSQIGEQYATYSFIMIGVLIAYLCFNTSPSSQLMGDAGSRPIGILIVLIVLKSSHPLSYLLLSSVLLVDGIAGLIKIFLKRFLKIEVLKNIRTPIHDEMRKNHGWSDTQVLIRFCIIQLFMSSIQYVISR
jgi:phospho-N-acetylmuramoyl-pentapeptide-transferase